MIALISDVVARGEVGVEAHAQLDERRHAADHLDRRRASSAVDAGEALEQRALPGAVAADDAEELTAPHLEAHVLERLEGVVGAPGEAGGAPAPSASSSADAAGERSC